MGLDHCFFQLSGVLLMFSKCFEIILILNLKGFWCEPFSSLPHRPVTFFLIRRLSGSVCFAFFVPSKMHKPPRQNQQDSADEYNLSGGDSSS